MNALILRRFAIADPAGEPGMAGHTVLGGEFARTE